MEVIHKRRENVEVSTIMIHDVGKVYYYNPNPTNNCQLGIFGCAYNFLGNCTSKEKIAILQSIGKPLILMDLRVNESEGLDNYTDSIVLRTEYDSTNGSKMVIIIINRDMMIKQLQDEK